MATKTAKTAPDEPTLRDSLRLLQGERAISFEMLLEALEAALISAYKRNFGGEANAIVSIDRDTGEYKVYHRRKVVEEVIDPKLEITKKEAGPKYELGDFYDEEVTPKNFGRIAAQTAKQVIVQRIREAERDTVFNKYSAKLHDLVIGKVQRYEQRKMFVDLETRPKRSCRSRSKCRARISASTTGSARSCSTCARPIRVRRSCFRARPKGSCSVCSSAKFPRSKTTSSRSWRSRANPGAVRKSRCTRTARKSMPVGACLGPKSSRIASVSDELRGEKIDIIRWSNRRRRLSSRTRSRPAKVLGVELFEDEGVGLVVVPDYQLSLAIGREGQNVRLAARLTGWRLDITSEAEAEETRARYLAEREERRRWSNEEGVEGEAVDGEAPRAKRSRASIPRSFASSRSSNGRCSTRRTAATATRKAARVRPRSGSHVRRVPDARAASRRSSVSSGRRRCWAPSGARARARARSLPLSAACAERARRTSDTADWARRDGRGVGRRFARGARACMIVGLDWNDRRGPRAGATHT